MISSLPEREAGISASSGLEASANSGPGRQISWKRTPPMKDLRALTVLGRSQCASGSSLWGEGESVCQVVFLELVATPDVATPDVV